MNQDAPKPSFELPPPVSEAGESSSLPHEALAPRPETASTPQITAIPQQQISTAQAAVQSAAQPAMPLPQSQPGSVSPAAADDNDLIEEEWVIKAKQIVAATRDDPHMQSRELSRFKADYLQKRYSKTIKLEES